MSRLQRVRQVNRTGPRHRPRGRHPVRRRQHAGPGHRLVAAVRPRPGRPPGGLRPRRGHQRRTAAGPARRLLHGVALGRPRRRAQYVGRLRPDAPDVARRASRRRPPSTRWARATARSSVPSELQAQRERIGKDALSTLAKAATLTSIGKERLKSDAVANVCGGAAVLADYQREAGGARDLGDWAAAVARYSGADDQATALRFAKQVFATIRTGKARTTNDGQRVSLRANPSARVDRRPSSGSACPWPATRTTPTARPGWAASGCPRRTRRRARHPGAYGHHDLADRPQHRHIDYIVIHDTEANWNTTLQLINDPTYAASWHYSLRSVDGHIAQHVDQRRRCLARRQLVRERALDRPGARGLRRRRRRLVHRVALPRARRRWYVTSPASTASPLDRAHIIGHDQVPGTTAGDRARHALGPGPVLGLGALLQPARLTDPSAPKPNSSVVTVAAGLRRQHPAGDRMCRTVDVTLRAPGHELRLPLQPARPGLAVGHRRGPARDGGAPSTTNVSDYGARAAAGQQLVVQEVLGDWTKVWWLGADAWVYNPQTSRTLIPSQGQVVTPAATTPAPIYGRAYPEAAAYPAGTDRPVRRAADAVLDPAGPAVRPRRRRHRDRLLQGEHVQLLVRPDCIQIAGADRTTRSGSGTASPTCGRPTSRWRTESSPRPDGAQAARQPTTTSTTATAHSANPPACARWTCSRRTMAASSTVNAG